MLYVHTFSRDLQTFYEFIFIQLLFTRTLQGRNTRMTHEDIILCFTMIFALNLENNE
jgi:hypothetical protein